MLTAPARPAEGFAVTVRGRPKPPKWPWPRVLNWGAIAAVIVVALADLERSSRGWDAYTQRAVVERTAALGGTYFTTGSDQKGPLWLGAYSLVWHLTTRTTFWFGVGVAIVVVAGVTAIAVGWILRRTGLEAWFANACATALFGYLVLSNEEFSHVLYSRNLVVMCETLAVAVLLSAMGHTGGRLPWLRLMLAGAFAGLAVQTMPASALFTLVVAGLCWWATRKGELPSRQWRRVPVAVVAVVGGWILPMAGIPLWYAGRGALHDFWQQWWVYNRTYSEATGKGLPTQMWDGTADFLGYYGDHALIAFGIIAAAVITRRRWSELTGLQRAVVVAAVVWWVGECTSVALSQRFFGHYLVLPFVPAVLLGFLALGRVSTTPRNDRSARLAVPVVLLATVLLFGRDRFSDGWESLRSFRGFGDLADRRVEEISPERQFDRALFQFFTDPGEYVLVWSRSPQYYTDLDRPSATRWIENRWLTGEVFGGSTDPKWIFPDAWKKWSDDVARTPPVAVMTLADEPVPPGSPLASMLATYDKVYSDKVRTVYLVAGRAEARLDSAGSSVTPAVVRAGAASQWRTGTTLQWTPSGSAPAPSDVAVIDDLPACFALSGTVTTGRFDSFPALVMAGGLPAGEYNSFTFGETSVTSETLRDGYFAPLAQFPSMAPQREFTMVAGQRAAVVMVDGAVVGAVERKSNWQTGIRPWAGPFEVSGLEVHPRPDLCG